MKFILLFSTLIIGLCIGDILEIPNLDDIDAIKERCEEKGGPNAYQKLKNAQEQTVTCIKGLIDIETVKKEIQEARKRGAMDEVFGKYCNKRPQLKDCLKTTADAVESCIDENEKQFLNNTGRILEQVGDFVCYDDGDRIAMFVAEGGVECLQSRSEQIQNCFNQTVKFNPANVSPNSIPNLVFDKKKCDNMMTIKDCIVADLEENCEDTTPANIVGAMFRYVKKLACKDVNQ